MDPDTALTSQKNPPGGGFGWDVANRKQAAQAALFSQ